MTAEARSPRGIPLSTWLFTLVHATRHAWHAGWRSLPKTEQAKGPPMRELLGALIWLAICVVSIIFWWPLVVVVVQYWL